MSSSDKTQRCPKLLVWQKTNSSPLMISNLAESPTITKALVGSFKSASKGILEGKGIMVQALLCTETAVQILLMFIRQLKSKVPFDKYQFWEELAVLVNEDLDLRPFQTHFQTQALLHKVHLHLTISPNSCPICQGQPLSSTVAQYSIAMDPKYSSIHVSSPIFLVFVHKDQNKFCQSFVHSGPQATQEA